MKTLPPDLASISTGTRARGCPIADSTSAVESRLPIASAFR